MGNRMITGVLTATAIVGGVGLFIGLFLGVAAIKFKVEVDEKEEAVLNALPGNNCGGCGFPGCSGLAAAIAKGEAPVNACPVGGEPVGKVIAGIMGAFGAALAARELHLEQSALLSPQALDRFSHTAKPVTCNLCTNHCSLTVNTFDAGRSFISGNRCSRPLGQEKVEIPDLMKFKYDYLRTLEGDISQVPAVQAELERIRSDFAFIQKFPELSDVEARINGYLQLDILA